MPPQIMPLWHRIILSWRQLKIRRCRKNSLLSSYLPKDFPLWRSLHTPSLCQEVISDSYYQRWRVNTEINLYKHTLQKWPLSSISYPIFPQLFLSHSPAIYHLLKPQPSPLLKWHISPKWKYFFEFQFFAVNSMHVTINKHCVPFLLLICLLFNSQAPMDWTNIVKENFFFPNTWIHWFNPPKQPYQVGASILIL